MKATALVPIFAGENAIFAEGCAEKMIGQEGKGFTVVGAKQEAPDKIMLTVEVNLSAGKTDLSMFGGLRPNKNDRNRSGKKQ